jgi:hypothetical protein
MRAAGATNRASRASLIPSAQGIWKLRKADSDGCGRRPAQEQLDEGRLDLKVVNTSTTQLGHEPPFGQSWRHHRTHLRRRSLTTPNLRRAAENFNRKRMDRLYGQAGLQGQAGVQSVTEAGGDDPKICCLSATRLTLPVPFVVRGKTGCTTQRNLSKSFNCCFKSASLLGSGS